MKIFLKKSLFFLFPFALIIYSAKILMLSQNDYRLTINGFEIYESINLSNKPGKIKSTLLLGDSVGYQFFPNTIEDENLISLACNQAISLVGQYILLKNFIDAGNKVDKVILVYNPYSFMNNLQQIYTFHYFLKPFYKKEYIPLFSEMVNEQISNIPYYWLSREPLIASSNWSPSIKAKDYSQELLISPISQEYLMKIDSLCLRSEITFKILSPPIRENFKARLEKKINRLTVPVNIKQEWNNYIESMNYLPETEFIDNSHLRNPENYMDDYLKLIK